VTNPAWTLVPGRYTDDTQMSIAIAEAIVDGVAWAPAALTDEFVEVFNATPAPATRRGFTTL